MVTKLHGQLRREIRISGIAYVVTMTEGGLKLTEKGRRKGFELTWKDLVSGDAALAVALNASVDAAPAPRPKGKGPARTRRAGPKRTSR
jgi:hypothetical protein